MSAAGSPRSALNLAAGVSGVMLIVAGIIAVATGEFDRAGLWVLVVGLAAIGLAGVAAGFRAIIADR